MEASNFLAGRCARRPVRMRGRGRWLVASCWAARPRAACVPRARLWELAICLQYVSDGCTLHQRLLGAVCCSRLNIGGLERLWGLTSSQAWFCARARHDRPTAAKQTSYEHRLSNAQRDRLSFPVEKDPFARKQGNTWLLHSTSRPWSTPWPRGRPSRTPLRPVSALAPFNLRLSRRSLEVVRRTRERPTAPQYLGGQK